MAETITVQGQGGAVFEVDRCDYIEKQLAEGLIVEVPQPSAPRRTRRLDLSEEA